VSSHKLDCQNMACPTPVIQTKEALEEFDEGILDVELNTYSSIQNVKKFAASQGLFCEEKKLGINHVILTIVKGYECGIDPSGEVDPMVAELLEQKKDDRRFYVLMFSGIVSAILASTCCLGPLLFLLFGMSAGSLGFLSYFAPYHDWFSLGSIVVVGWLWIDYIRKRRHKVTCSTVLCKNYLLYLGIGTLFVTILVTYPWWVNYLIPMD